MAATEKSTSRNWTFEETNLFCSILVDPTHNYLVQLEKKAIKKASTRELFQEILDELTFSFDEEPFKSVNEVALKSRKMGDLHLDVKKLQYKYNNIKQYWRRIKERQRNNGMELVEQEDLPEWYSIVNPVLEETNLGKEKMIYTKRIYPLSRYLDLCFK